MSFYNFRTHQHHTSHYYTLANAIYSTQAIFKLDEVLQTVEANDYSKAVKLLTENNPENWTAEQIAEFAQEAMQYAANEIVRSRQARIEEDKIKVEQDKQKEAFQVRIRQIVAAIGEGWHVLDRADREDCSNLLAVAQHPNKACGLYIQTEDFFKSKPKLRVGLEEFKLRDFIYRNDRPDSICISLSKTDAQIGKEIARRFVSEVDRVSELATKRKEAAEARENAVESNCERLIKAAGIIAKRSEYQGAKQDKVERRYGANVPNFEAKVSKESIDLKFSDLPVELAESILHLVYGQHNAQNVANEREAIENQIANMLEWQEEKGEEGEKARWEKAIAHGRARLDELNAQYPSA